MSSSRLLHAASDAATLPADPHHHPHGLAHDLRALDAARARRRALGWLAGLAGAGTWPLLGCGGGGDSGTTTTASSSTGSSSSSTGSSSSSSSSASTPTTSSGSCSVIPTETNGPYPADGTTALNALLLSGIVRSDIRSSFNGANATAAGIPLTVTLTLVNANASCASLAGYAIYIWHCDRSGNYSLYSSSVASQNYLRGVQATDASGQVTFTTIFPACYAGRWPHIHVEIYPSLAKATSVSNVLKITQIAMTATACNAVYATTGYSQSVTNLSQVSLTTDGIFADGAALETPTITGDVTNGYTLALTMAIAA